MWCLKINESKVTFKPDGTYRFYVDYRDSNKGTRNDVYLIPHMDSILYKLRYLPEIDLRQAYLQVQRKRLVRNIHLSHCHSQVYGSSKECLLVQLMLL